MGRRRRSSDNRNLRTLTGRGRGRPRSTASTSAAATISSAARTGRINERQTRAQTRAREDLLTNSNEQNRPSTSRASTSNNANDDAAGVMNVDRRILHPRNPEVIPDQPVADDVAILDVGVPIDDHDDGGDQNMQRPIIQNQARRDDNVVANVNEVDQNLQQRQPPVVPPRVEANRLLEGNLSLRTNQCNNVNTMSCMSVNQSNMSNANARTMNNDMQVVSNNIVADRGVDGSSSMNSSNVGQDVTNVPLQASVTDTSHDLFRQQQLGFTPLVSAFTPLGTGVAQSIKSKIIKGEYVDLVTLLEKKDPYMQYHESQGIALSVNESGQIIWKSNKPKQMITSISAWTSAFLIFSSVYLNAHPNRTQELLKYMHLVRTAASRYGGFGWRSYDQQFRLRMQECPQRSWAVIDSELWSLYMTQSSAVGNNFPIGVRQQSQNVGGFRPQFPGRQMGNSGFRTQFTNAGWKPKEKICFDFNKKSCQRKPCMYKHKCMHCKEPGHGAVECKKV